MSSFPQFQGEMTLEPQEAFTPRCVSIHHSACQQQLGLCFGVIRPECANSHSVTRSTADLPCRDLRQGAPAEAQKFMTCTMARAKAMSTQLAKTVKTAQPIT
jgi:hypothetical protein